MNLKVIDKRICLCILSLVVVCVINRASIIMIRQNVELLNNKISIILNERIENE